MSTALLLTNGKTVKIMESAVNTVIKEVLERGNVSRFNSMDIEDLSGILQRYKRQFKNINETPKDVLIFINEDHFKRVIKSMVDAVNSFYERKEYGVFRNSGNPMTLVPEMSLYMNGITMTFIIKPDISDILLVPYTFEDIDYSKSFVIQIEGK